MDEDVKRAWLLVAAHDLHPGDKHPTKRGWVLAKDLGPRGEPVFYREAGHAKRMQFLAECRQWAPIWLLLVGGVALWYGVIEPLWRRLGL